LKTLFDIKPNRPILSNYADDTKFFVPTKPASIFLQFKWAGDNHTILNVDKTRLSSEFGRSTANGVGIIWGEPPKLRRAGRRPVRWGVTDS